MCFSRFGQFAAEFQPGHSLEKGRLKIHGLKRERRGKKTSNGREGDEKGGGGGEKQEGDAVV